MGEGHTDMGNVWLRLFGVVVIAGIVVFIAIKETSHLPLGKLLRSDPEFQIFAALLI